MEVRIAPDTRKALESDASLRFLFKAMYKHRDRHSQKVIPWAEKKVTAVGGAMLKEIGREAAGVNIQMNMISMIHQRNYVLICFDLFLQEGGERGQMQQPVHMISTRGTIYHVYRDKKLDAMIAARFIRYRETDKGPLPYFSDLQNPPLYVDGRRLERPSTWSDSGPEKEKGLLEDMRLIEAAAALLRS